MHGEAGRRQEGHRQAGHNSGGLLRSQHLICTSVHEDIGMSTCMSMYVYVYVYIHTQMLFPGICTYM